MSARFENLVDVYDHASQSFATRELFGTKTNGKWVWTTYREFHDQVEKARDSLASLGLSRGDKVAVIADNRIE